MIMLYKQTNNTQTKFIMQEKLVAVADLLRAVTRARLREAVAAALVLLELELELELVLELVLELEVVAGAKP